MRPSLSGASDSSGHVRDRWSPRAAFGWSPAPGTRQHTIGRITRQGSGGSDSGQPPATAARLTLFVTRPDRHRSRPAPPDAVRDRGRTASRCAARPSSGACSRAERRAARRSASHRCASAPGCSSLAGRLGSPTGATWRERCWRRGKPVPAPALLCGEAAAGAASGLAPRRRGRGNARARLAGTSGRSGLRSARPLPASVLRRTLPFGSSLPCDGRSSGPGPGAWGLRRGPAEGLPYPPPEGPARCGAIPHISSGLTKPEALIASPRAVDNLVSSRVWRRPPGPAR